MSIAREIMQAGATCVQESETLETAAQRMRELKACSAPGPELPADGAQDEP